MSLVTVPPRQTDGTDLQCNNTSHCGLCTRLKLQMVDAYGNPAGTAADAVEPPLLRVRLEGPLTGADDVYEAGARPPTLLPVEFKPFGGSGASESGTIGVQPGSGSGDAVYALHFEGSGSSALALPAPLRVRFTDTQGLDQQQRQLQEQASQLLRQRRQRFEELKDEQMRDLAQLAQRSQELNAKAANVSGLFAQVPRLYADCVRESLAPFQGVEVTTGVQISRAEIDQLQAPQNELANLEMVLSNRDASVRDKQLEVERAGALLPQVAVLLRLVIERSKQRAQGFAARTGYQAPQLEALRGVAVRELAVREQATQQAGRSTREEPGILGVLSELLVLSCDEIAHTRTLAALLSDLAGSKHLKSVVVRTNRADTALSAPLAGGHSVKLRMGRPRVWILEVMSQGGKPLRP